MSRSEPRRPTPATRASRLLLTLAVLTWSSSALADPKDDARRHFSAGLAAAQSQDYDRALEEFLAAQDAWPHPATLYNIARSYADLGQLEAALEYYRLYAAAAPEKADDVAPVVAVIEARLRQRNAPPAAVATPAPAATTPSAAPVRSADLDRLAAIAAEIEEIRASLATAPPAPEPAPGAAPPTEVIPEAAPAPADDASLPSGSLLSDAYERVVVTASRYGQAPLDSPSSVTILTDEDIRLGGATTVPDLLRRVVGVDVMGMTASQPDLSIRGFNRELSNKVLVLVDGRSAYLDFLGTVFWPSLPISLDEIERIEIIRGPGSAIYGANAMTGVINIITRPPGQGRTQVHVAAGYPALVQGTALADGRSGRTAWRLSAGWDQVGRWNRAYDPATQTALTPLLDEDSLAAAVARANGRIDQSFLDKGLASVSAGWARGSNEFVSLGALGDFGLAFNSGYARADIAYGPVHLRSFYNTIGGTTGAYAEYDGSYSSATTFDSDTVDLELEALGDFSTGPIDHRLNAGAGYRYKRIAWDYLAGDGEPIDEHHLNAFLQEQAKVGPVALVASLRVDRHPLVDLSKTISPRGAAIVRVAPNTSLRVTGGTAFRSPTFIETYLDLDLPTDADGVYVHDLGMYVRDASAEISPERILTGEIAVHDESSRIHTADLALYANRVTDLIGLTDLEPELSFYDDEIGGFFAGTTGFTNLSPVYTAVGGELDVRVFPVDGLDLYANLAIERITENADGVVTVDQSTSLAKLNLGAMYRTPFRVDLAAHLSYVSPQVWGVRDFDDTGALVNTPVDVEARTLLSAHVGVRPFQDDKLEVAVNGWNLLQAGRAGYRENPKGQLVGARYWGDLTWRF